MRGGSQMSWKVSAIMAAACLLVGVGIGSRWRTDAERAERPEEVSHAERGVRDEVAARSAIGNESRAVSPGRAIDRLRAGLGVDGKIDAQECFGAIAELSLSECREAWLFVRKERSPETRFLMEAIARRWAELDANDALMAALKETDRDFSRHLGPEAAKRLVRENLEDALDLIQSTPVGSARIQLSEWILGEAAAISPRRAAELISTERGLRRSSVVFQVAREWGRQNPEAALQWTASLPEGNLRENSTKMVWSGWAEKDPAAVAGKLKEEASQAVKEDHDIYQLVAGHWAKSDPAAAIAWIETIESKEGLERAMRGLNSMQVSELGVAGAQALINGAKTEAVRTQLTREMVRQLAKGDVQEAFAFVDGLNDAQAREQAFRPILEEWTQQNPAEASRYVAGMPEGKERTELMRRTMEHWAQAEPEAAAEFAEQLPPGKERDFAALQLTRAWREEDPQKGLEFLRRIEDPGIAAEAAKDLVEVLVRSDRAAAVAIANELPEQAQAGAYHGLVRGWAFGEPHAAGEWINQLPPGAGKDSAIEAYVSVIDGMDARSATQWATAIGDPKKRAEATMNAFQRWLGQDRAAAGAWLQQAELAEGLRPFFDHELRQVEKKD